MEGSDRTFEIATCLGRGGFGEVYRARMSRSGGLAADVALKVLRRDIDPDGQAVQRLRDEGKLLSQLNHPSILKVHDLVVLAGRIALITEYVDGDDLSDCLKQDDGPGSEGRTPIGPRALLQVIARVASALDAAWTARTPDSDGPLRMVHRDIKPSNIRLSRHGDVKLLDFGIARTDAVEREARTRTDMMVGSPAYMAPERFLEKEVLLESDVFSLGAVLFEGLAPDRYYGDLPVPMQVGLAVAPERFATHLEGRLAMVRFDEEDADATRVLHDLLRRTLSYVPSERPSPAVLAQECDALADRLGGPTLSRFCRSRAWLEPGASARVSGELDGSTLTEGMEHLPRHVEPTSGISRVESLEAPRSPPQDPTIESLEPLTSPSLPADSMGSMERPRATDPARARDSSRPPDASDTSDSSDGDGSVLGWALVGVGGVGALVTAVVGLLTLLGVLTLPFALGPGTSDTETTRDPGLGGLDDPSLQPEPSIPREPDPKPEPEPVPEPEPDPRPPTPIQPVLQPAPAPQPAPMPAPAPPPEPTPQPEPAPTPPPAGPPPGRVDVEASFAVYAVGPRGPVRLPADLPPGTWPIRAAFNGVEVVDANEQVQVASGGRVVVRCSDRFQRCTVD